MTEEEEREETRRCDLEITKMLGLPPSALNQGKSGVALLIENVPHLMAAMRSSKGDSK